MPGQSVYIRNPEYNEAFKAIAKNVTTAGTAVQLSSTSIACVEVLIQAKQSNTGRIYVGPSTVTHDDTVGISLSAGDVLKITTDDLSKIYLDCTVNGEGVTCLYWGTP